MIRPTFLSTNLISTDTQSMSLCPVAYMVCCQAVTSKNVSWGSLCWFQFFYASFCMQIRDTHNTPCTFNIFHMCGNMYISGWIIYNTLQKCCQYDWIKKLINDFPLQHMLVQCFIIKSTYEKCMIVLDSVGMQV